MIVSNKYVKSSLDFAGKYLHAPEQRMILGATALATQPVIDLKNKEVDEETRMTSVARTIAKIVAGTIVGVVVRYAGIEAAKAFSKYKTVVDKESQKVIQIIPDAKRGQLVPLFAGKKTIFPIEEEILKKRFTKYQKAMGIFAATVAMIGTNFLIDAPLTKYFTGKFTKMLLPENKESEVQK